MLVHDGEDSRDPVRSLADLPSESPMSCFHTAPRSQLHRPVHSLTAAARALQRLCIHPGLARWSRRQRPGLLMPCKEMIISTYVEDPKTKERGDGSLTASRRR